MDVIPDVLVVFEVVVEVVEFDPESTVKLICCEVIPLPSGFCEAETMYVPETAGEYKQLQYPTRLLVIDP